MFRTLNTPHLIITLAAAGIMMVTMGSRQSLGLFVAPLNTSTGLGIVSISFALAVGQFVWGAIQPIAGAVADRFRAGQGPARRPAHPASGSRHPSWIPDGASCSPSASSPPWAPASAAPVLMGATAQRLPPPNRALPRPASSMPAARGQFIFAPVLQKMIQVFGWMGTMWSMAAIAIARCRWSASSPQGTKPPAALAKPAWNTVCGAMGDRSYLLLHAGFLHLRLPHRLPRHPPAGRGRSVRPAGLGGELDAGHHRPDQHRRQPLRRHAVSLYRGKMVLF